MFLFHENIPGKDIIFFDFYKVNKINVDLATWNIYTNLSKFENKF
jgi:hypothetical protein